MKHSLTTIALGSLLLSQSVLAGLYSAKDNVIELTTQSFQNEVMDSNHLVMVEFYAPWCGHCKNLAPQYKAAAKNLHGIVKLGAIDCDNDSNRPICSQYGIQGFPTIKVFSPSRSGKKSVKYPKDYNGERSAKAIVDYLVPMIPNDIKLVSSNPSSEGITNVDDFVANDSESRALLFTKKTSSSNMYKGLATDMKDRMIVAEMRSPSDEVLKKFNIESLPALVVFPHGSQEPTIHSGDMKRDPMSEFLNQHAKPSAGSNNGEDSSSKKKRESSSSQSSESKAEKEEPIVIEFNPEVSQVVDQTQFKKECLNKAKGSCVIAFLVVEPEFPESVQIHEENMETLRQVKKAAHEANKPHNIMWMDALDKRVIALRDQFQVSSDVPGLLLINPGKKAFVPFIGRFGVEGIQEWLSDATSGRARALAYDFDVVLAAPESKKEDKEDNTAKEEEEVKERTNIKDEL